MTTPHPNREVLIALAEGKTVQFGSERCNWVDYDPSLYVRVSPIDSDPEVKWRVKPELIERWLVIPPSGSEYVCDTLPATPTAWRVVHLREVES